MGPRLASGLKVAAQRKSLNRISRMEREDNRRRLCKMEQALKGVQEGQGCVFKKVAMVDSQTAFKSLQRTMDIWCTAKRITELKC